MQNTRVLRLKMYENHIILENFKCGKELEFQHIF